MKERTTVLILTFILLAIGAFAYYFQMNHYSDFNFYRSELNLNNGMVQEKLFYLADYDYHTLYRNFQNSLSIGQDNLSNSIVMKSVECDEGTPYFKILYQCYDNSSVPVSCLPYTENNEYGCSFGDTYGFLRGGDYEIGASYELNPENLFLIGDNYYIKFVAYSANGHKNLVLGNDLIINDGVIANSQYLYDEQLIVYVPFKGNTSGFNIINQTDFQFDNTLIRHLILLLTALLPGILFFISWHFFGKENYEEDIPDRLSMYPNKRKAWEVAVFFNPPLGSSNPNLISTLMTDLYFRKIIDIKMKEKDVYVKINEHKNDLDDTEKNFIKLLKLFEEKSIKDGSYFLLKSSKLKFRDQLEASKISQNLTLGISKLRPKYLSSRGIAVLMLPLFFASMIAFSFSVIVAGFVFVAGIILAMVSAGSTLLVKFKERYYPEYQKWQSFRRFLSGSSLNLHGHKGTIVWGEFLVYATALGVAKKVLKEMKLQGIITSEQYNSYSVMSSPMLLSSVTGGFGGGYGSSGGFGGAGGGGVGGGGGGGR